MDEAGATKTAALDSIGDVEPAGLADRIEQWLDDGSMVPGTLTIYCARTQAEQSVRLSNGDLDETLADRAAGVQLIYEGLRLTRQLAHDEPWETGSGADADLDILVADVLVARGFRLLARTNAAEKAVETVRAFGRDQTVQHESADDSLNANLEGDVLELAVIAGSGFGSAETPTGISEFVTEHRGQLVTPTPGFPPAEQFFAGSESAWLQRLDATSSGGDGLKTSVDD